MFHSTIMYIIPVIDLLAGQVVRGIAGRREEYRPIISLLTASSRPRDVARAFREHFDLTELYLADLDAIAGKEPAWETYADLFADGFQLWVDAGVCNAERGRLLASRGLGVVAGLETLAGPAALAELCRDVSDRLIFSLDLRGGVPLGNTNAWQAADDCSIAGQAIALGVRRLLILDLERVGVGAGTGTEELCKQLTCRYPQLEVWAGGGVRGRDDLRRLQHCGVKAVLVASVLHNGALTRADLDGLNHRA